MNQIVFLTLSSIAIIGALLVIFSKNPVYSVLFLILTFFAIAGHFAFLLHAEFLAIVNIIVYAGAIMVLFLFVIMLLNLNKDAEPAQPVFIKLAAIISGALLMITLFGALKGANIETASSLARTDIGYVKNLGKVLFNEFLLPFEISSVLFLSAMIGAVMLGKKDLRDH
ncbi:MAG TPA: NADH-quinone oxidoreductase subunit J [Cytophagaceae bacterium]|jgi:NADH-quinone oxidoreductase subunit J